MNFKKQFDTTPRHWLNVTISISVIRTYCDVSVLICIKVWFCHPWGHLSNFGLKQC